MTMKPTEPSFRHPRRQNNNTITTPPPTTTTTTTSSHLLLLILSLLFSSSITTTEAQSQSQAERLGHGGGLWGSIKDGIYEPIVRPAAASIAAKYGDLSDEGRFAASACVGFGASRFAVRATVKTVKTVGVAYIAFEALEYCGLLKEARRRTSASPSRRRRLAQSRDYALRTADGMRRDIRAQLSSIDVSRRAKARMERDKAGTIGFGAGAFLGFAL